MAAAQGTQGGPSGARAVPVWLTDGSPGRFSDVHRLRARHRTILGIPAPYKGCVDPAVPVGAATIRGDQPGDVLLPEAEWALTFPDGMRPYLEAPERVDPATPVVLQGLIEGKWPNRMLAQLGRWRVGSLGNNLLAEGPGIPTSIGAIEGAGVRGEVEVAYRYPRGGPAGPEQTRVQRTTLADLRHQNLLGLVREVLRVCRERGEPIEAIDLSAMGEAAAVANERGRFWASARFERVPLPDPRKVFPLMRLAERVVRGVLAEGLGVPPGTPITIVTRDQQGAVVGRGTLTWQAGTAA
jgi:hypothetical protein